MLDAIWVDFIDSVIAEGFEKVFAFGTATLEVTASFGGGGVPGLAM
jgi:hypothetical protein